ncbi:hypothetical protein ACQEU5_10360 [Marinactinospora thermotolerans]|uniref:Uncharacterized protein n=1 Tax=Marinactinospora thermotolerans DSM 45154 TaxID=1122192 RepID=A0A1T4N0U0_9ACTN|nr:hypothetical protein [Marinactinospora thermotolerans]SJZ72909.1 hypothetical protein SAMN02745673_01226 [Marinactinospora thermotolerans DSM 45154]
MASTREGDRRRPGSVYLGWRYEVVVADPGPAPRRPSPSERETLDEEWAAARRRAEAQSDRPLSFALAALAGIALLAVALWPLGVLPGLFAVSASLACLIVAAPIALAVLQGRQAVRRRLVEERRRVEELDQERERLLRERQEEHAREYAEWETRRRAYEAQPRWYGVAVPEWARLATVAGGTPAGWSALLANLGASLLRDGGDLTVVDLSGRAVAGDLASLARRCAVLPRIWVLPADLPHMTLGANLDAAGRAGLLAVTARASEPAADVAADREFLTTLLGILGADAPLTHLTAALRALALPDGSGADDDPALSPLTAEQRRRLRDLPHPDRADRLRAAELERRLVAFEGLGAQAVEEPYAQIKIIATDRSSGERAGRSYGTYALAALSELLRMRARRGNAPRPWAHTIVVCGADALPDARVRDLLRAAGAVGAGVVLLYRRASRDALAMLGEDGCLPVLMRQPDARAASEAAARVGEGHRLPLHPLTEVVGEALGDSIADGYVTDPAESVTTGIPVRHASRTIPPLDLVRHVRSATAWGRVTAQAADVSGSATPGETLRCDATGMRALPPTAMLVLDGGTPVLADANPGILTLPDATLATAAGPGGVPAPAPAAEEDEAPRPNLGPPPERPDWRNEGGMREAG